MDKAEFERGINSIKRDTNLFKRETDNLTKASERQNMAIGTGTRALTSMRSQYTQLNNQMGYYATKLKEEEEAGRKGQAQWSKYANQLQETSSKMANLTSQYDDFSKRLFTANSPFTKLGNNLEAIGSGAINFGQGLEQVGSTITRIGAVATAGGAMFIKTAMGFEDGMVHIRKTTDMGTADLGKLENAIKDMAGEMPIAVEQLQNVAGIAGQLGVRGVENITHFTETMSKIGTATSLSAEEASEAIARFTNITGTGQTTIGNLGSALVELGNNFATTETEIMSMAGRLVGTLTTVGVGEADILGLAGAMSALGITAERGASSMSKFFVDMAGAVSEGGEQLALLAEVAGMTSSEFATLFGQDSMGALEAFIGGLAEIDASGGDLIKWMDDLGITGERIRDTILKLANGHEVLDDALKSSNEAYKDATALEKEYQIMLESTSAQWELAKNSVKLFAIEIGQELLPVVIDLLNQSGGIKDMANDFVTWFKNLDEGVQNNIVKWGALSVVIGPVISGLGSIITVGGQVLTFLASANKALGLADGALKALSFGTITGEVTGLGGAVGLLNPQLGAVIASLALIGGGVYAWSVLTEEVRHTKKALEDFPSVEGITSEQVESIESTYDAYSDLNIALETLSGQTMTYADTVSEAVSKIVEEISRINDDRLNEMTELYESLPVEVQAMYDELIKEEERLGNHRVNRAKDTQDSIIQVMKNASDEGRELNDFENAYIIQSKRELAQLQADSLGETAEQSRQIYSVIMADLANMNQDQLIAHGQNLQVALTNMDRGLEAQKNKILEVHGDTKLSRTLISSLEEVYDTTRNSLMTEWAKTLATTSEMAGAQGEELYNIVANYMNSVIPGLNILPEEVEAMINSTSSIMTEGVDNFMTPLEGANQRIVEAAQKVNYAVWEFANGMNKNVSELNADDLDNFVSKIEETDITWHDLLFLSKSADIDDNTKAFLDAIAEAYGGWDNIELMSKEAKIEVYGEEELNEILKLFGTDFASLNDERKEAVLETYGSKELSDILFALGLWQTAPLDAKQAVIEADPALAAFKELFQNKGWWDDSTFIGKVADIETNSPEFLEKLVKAISEWSGIPYEEVKQMLLSTNSESIAASVGKVIDAHKTAGRRPVSKLDTSTNSKVTTTNIDKATDAHKTAGRRPTAKLDTSTNSNTTRSGINKAIDVHVIAGRRPTAKLDTSTNSKTTTTNIDKATDAHKTAGRRPTSKLTTSTNADTTKWKITDARDALSNINNRSARVYLYATDYATGVIGSVGRGLSSLNGRTATTYVNTVSRGGIGRHQGTNYHQGGLATLGDGGVREPFLTPDGRLGVSPAHDTLYDLPTGSKVWSSINRFRAEAMGNSMLKPLIDQMPKYAKGTDRSFLDEARTFKVPSSFSNNNSQDSGNNLNLNIAIELVGNSISRTQADKIIEPLVEASERLSKKRGMKFNFS